MTLSRFYPGKKGNEMYPKFNFICKHCCKISDYTPTEDQPVCEPCFEDLYDADFNLKEGN